MKEKLISREEIRPLQPIFRGKQGDRWIDFGMKLSGINKVNALYDASKHLTGPAFCSDILDQMGVIRTVRNGDLLVQYENEPFITVSNHPYGHLDGLSLIETVASRLPHFKVLVNVVLSLIDTMNDNFISVNPYSFSTKKHISFNGLRESLSHLKNGHPIGFFPAGAVTNLYLKHGRWVYEDREWQPSVMRIIQKTKKTVIPIHISGGNSFLFYALRMFGWKARNLRLCHEMTNKQGHEVVLTVGEPLSPSLLKTYPDPVELGAFLKKTTYALGDRS